MEEEEFDGFDGRNHCRLCTTTSSMLT